MGASINAKLMTCQNSDDHSSAESETTLRQTTAEDDHVAHNTGGSSASPVPESAVSVASPGE